MQITEEELAGLEAVLMVVDAPVSVAKLAETLERPEEHVDRMLHHLRAEYDGTLREGGRMHGFELRQAGGGWRIAARSGHETSVARFVLQGQTARLSQAALETLAVVAYRQPVSRSRIAAIRGVNVDGVVRTLVTRKLIEERGEDEATGAVLFGTTGAFLEHLGLDSIDELPELSPLLPGVENLDEILAEDL
ncbi:MAG: SMC-Scp complex subunit ScpB [Galactobacter sp.]